MAGLSRLWVRLWVLAGVSILLSVTLLVGAFIGLQLWLEHVARNDLPPEVTAEMRRLESLGQTLDIRYQALFDRYIAPFNPINDYALLALLTLVSIAIAGASAFVMARRISRPISDVATAAGRIAEGDLDVRVSPAGTSGETAELVMRFNAMADEIEQYERERRILTAGIAHELRTPLTVIKGRLHALVDGVIPMDRAEATRLLRNADQLSRLVEDLRTLAHADAGELELDLQVVQLAGLVEGLLADLAPEAHRSDVTFSHRGQPLAVIADPLRLTQILSNLLTNALKHSPPGTTISMNVGQVAEWIELRVEDEGSGFAPEDRDRMFTPFWRGEQDRAAGRAGSGMGLALALLLAQAQNGQLTASNREAGGARFVLRLPSAVRPG